MPGTNCAVPGCKSYFKKGSSNLSFFRVTQQNDDWSKEWRDKVLTILKENREMDENFKSLEISICENIMKRVVYFVVSLAIDSFCFLLTV